MIFYPQHKRDFLPIEAGEIIDSHTHCGGVLVGNILLGSYPYSQDTLDLIRKMRTHKVRYSICFPFPINNEVTPFFTPQLYNNLIAREAYTLGRGALLPFAFMRLDDTLQSQIIHLEELFKEYRFYGVKIYPPCDKYFLCDEKVEDDLTSFLLLHDFPLVIHTSFNGFGKPMSLLQFAKKHKDVRISFAHAARFDMDAFRIICDLPNVFIDCSPLNMLCALMLKLEEKNSISSNLFKFSNPKSVLHKLIELLPNHLLWGTDSPSSFLTNFSENAISTFSEKYTYESDMNILRQLSDREVQLIAQSNPFKFLFGSSS